MTKSITISTEQFDVNQHRAGEKSVVASATVPARKVWIVDSSKPLEIALSSKYTADDSGNDLTVDEGADTTLDLSAEGIPAIPQPVFMDSPVNGKYTEDAALVTLFDSTGDGTPDTVVTDSTTVQYNTFTTNDNGDITEITYTDTSGNASTKNIAIIGVQRQGQVEVRKQNQGVTQVLKSTSERSFVYSAPDDPDSNKQVVFPRAVGGEFGKTLPPKFRLEVVYFDNNNSVDLDDSDVENAVIYIPATQRNLGGVDPAQLRRRVRNDMLQAAEGN